MEKELQKKVKEFENKIMKEIEDFIESKKIYDSLFITLTSLDKLSLAFITPQYSYISITSRYIHGMYVYIVEHGDLNKVDDIRIFVDVSDRVGNGESMSDEIVSKLSKDTKKLYNYCRKLIRFYAVDHIEAVKHDAILYGSSMLDDIGELRNKVYNYDRTKNNDKKYTKVQLVNPYSSDDRDLFIEKVVRILYKILLNPNDMRDTTITLCIDYTHHYNKFKQDKIELRRIDLHDSIIIKSKYTNNLQLEHKEDDLFDIPMASNHLNSYAETNDCDSLNYLADLIMKNIRTIMVQNIKIGGGEGIFYIEYDIEELGCIDDIIDNILYYEKE